MSDKKGYIYIMTNPALVNMVKIGYATNVEERRKQLSTTALPYEYEVYATYETNIRCNSYYKWFNKKIKENKTITYKYEKTTH